MQKITDPNVVPFNEPRTAPRAPGEQPRIQRWLQSNPRRRDKSCSDAFPTCPAIAFWYLLAFLNPGRAFNLNQDVVGALDVPCRQHRSALLRIANTQRNSMPL